MPFPPEKQGAAMTMFGIAALLAPVVGPTLGGYITDNYGWRWIFYLNIPVGTIALVFCSMLLVDPDYLKERKAKLEKRRRASISIGLCLLAIDHGVLGSCAQQRTGMGLVRRPVLSRADAGGIFCLRAWPADLARAAHRQPAGQFPHAARTGISASCCIIIFCAFGVLYANTASLPALLQSLFGYDATHSGPGALAGGLLRGDRRY